VIIDDLMQETNEMVAYMFTKGSHHRNISVVFLAQKLFSKNNFARTMSLNAHYMVLFKNPRRQSVCKSRETDVSEDLPVCRRSV